MGILNEYGDHIRCDRCGKEVSGIDNPEVDEFLDFHFLVKREVFYRRPDPEIGWFCKKCAVEIMPLVYQLRDIDELRLFVNNLERAIRHVKSKNNGSTSGNACKGRARFDGRNNQSRSSDCAA